MASVQLSARNTTVSVSRRLCKCSSIQQWRIQAPFKLRTESLLQPPLPQCLAMQQRMTSFLHDTPVAVNTRSGTDISRINYAATSRLDKGKRSKISTLAADHLARADVYGYEDETILHQSTKESQEQASGNDQTISRNSRSRLVLVSSLVILILVGRDLLEVVLPGTIGLILYVASYIKSALRWLRSETKRDT